MDIRFSTDERLMYLVLLAGGGNRVLYNLYRESDEEGKKRIMAVMAAYSQELELAMDLYGLARDPEGVARAMVMTEDLIGCEPKGDLLSAGPDEAVRKVTFCPWSGSFSTDGGTCRLQMAAMEEGIGKKYGLEIFCEQTIAEGAEYCIWKVRKKS